MTKRAFFLATLLGLTSMNAPATENVDGTRELNQVYNQLLQNYSHNKKFIRRLKASQYAWEQYVDAQLRLRFPTIDDDDDGITPTAMFMCYGLYKSTLVHDRLMALKGWQQNDEGNVCQTLDEDK